MNELVVSPFLRNYKPLETLSYLTDKSWVVQEEAHSRYTVLTKDVEDVGAFEVIVPMSKGLRDWERRVRELIQTVTIEEDRPMEQIIEDLSLPNMDIVRTRIGIDSHFDGTLPMEDGTNAFWEVRNLFLAAACSAVNPKAMYTKRKYQEAMDYVRGARLGQTQRGSYVITVYSPILDKAPKHRQVSMDLGGSDPEGFGRRTIRMLNQALGFVSEEIRTMAQNGSIRDLGQMIHHGVSANLCDAVSSLNTYGGETGVEVSTSWSRTVKQPQDISSVHNFSSDSGSWLSKLSGNVKQKTDSLEDVVVKGAVRMMEATKPSEQGMVRVIGTLEDESATVELELSGEDYSKAVQAHLEEKPVEMIGNAKKRGKTWTLSGHRDFRIVEGD